MKSLARPLPALALLGLLALPPLTQAKPAGENEREVQRPSPAFVVPRPVPVQAPEWLSALPAPVVPAAHAAGLPMPDELLLGFAGLGVAAVGWRLRRRG